MTEAYVLSEEAWDTNWLSTIFECEDEYGKMMRMPVGLEENTISLIKKLEMKVADKRPLDELSLGIKIGTTEKLISNLKKFNKIQNRFAHGKWRSFEEHQSEIDEIIWEPGFRGPVKKLREWKFQYKKNSGLYRSEMGKASN